MTMTMWTPKILADADAFHENDEKYIWLRMYLRRVV